MIKLIMSAYFILFALLLALFTWTDFFIGLFIILFALFLLTFLWVSAPPLAVVFLFGIVWWAANERKKDKKKKADQIKATYTTPDVRDNADKSFPHDTIVPICRITINVNDDRDASATDQKTNVTVNIIGDGIDAKIQESK